MNKNTNYFYYAIQETENGRHYAHAWRTSAQNIISLVAQFKNAVVIHPTKTKSEAVRIAELWNNSFKENGTYLFSDSPLF